MVNCHIQVSKKIITILIISYIMSCKCKDICENGGDMAHFTAVHEASIFSGDSSQAGRVS